MVTAVVTSRSMDNTYPTATVVAHIEVYRKCTHQLPSSMIAGMEDFQEEKRVLQVLRVRSHIAHHKNSGTAQHVPASRRYHASLTISPASPVRNVLNFTPMTFGRDRGYCMLCNLVAWRMTECSRYFMKTDSVPREMENKLVEA